MNWKDDLTKLLRMHGEVEHYPCYYLEDFISQTIAQEKAALLAEAERLIAGIKPIHPYDDVTDPINTAYQRSIQALRMLAHSQEDREGK